VKRVIGAIVLAAALTLSLVGVTVAAQPANQACFGKDVSGYATGGGALHPGVLLPTLVQMPGPWGQIVQLHQAGFVPDSAIDNSCNDA
jgi:hypothetical protein